MVSFAGARPRYSRGGNARAPTTRPSTSERVSISTGQACAQRASLRNVALTRSAPARAGCGRTSRSTRVIAAGSRHAGTSQRRIAHAADTKDRKSVEWGKSVSVRVDLGGRGIINKKKKKRKQR